MVHLTKVLVIFLKAVSFVYSINLCMKWKISQRNLTLICEAARLRFGVTISDPSNSVLGFCYPPHVTSLCSSKYKMYQDLLTNKTIVTIPLDRPVNGNWTCRHGTNIDKTTVEVIFSGFNGILGQESVESKELACWLKLILWTFLGFMPFFLLTRLLLLILGFVCFGKDDMNHLEMVVLRNVNKSIQKFVYCKSNMQRTPYWILIWKRIISFIVTCMVFAMSYFVGKEEGNMCIGQYSFIVLGCFLGVFISLLLIDGREVDQTPTWKDRPCIPNTDENIAEVDQNPTREDRPCIAEADENTSEEESTV